MSYYPQDPQYSQQPQPPYPGNPQPYAQPGSPYAISYGHAAGGGRPTSVTALGVIGIVLAAIMILNHGAGLLLHSAGMLPAGPPGADAGVRTWTLADSSVSLVIALLLLAVSIAGLGLKPFARRWWIVYAVAHLGWLAVCIIVAMTFTIPQTLARTQTNPNVPRGAFQAGAYGGALCVLLVASVYPVFVLAFMNKPHVKAAFEGTADPGAAAGGYPWAQPGMPPMPPPQQPPPPPGPYGR